MSQAEFVNFNAFLALLSGHAVMYVAGMHSSFCTQHRVTKVRGGRGPF